MAQTSETGDIRNRGPGQTLYCHFSFKRPTDATYGLFAVAVYRDFEGRKILAQITRKLQLWENHQFVTAIQSYEHALYCISEWQGMMRDANVRMVMLVTDNSTLAGWIENPSKNKAYTRYMQRAVSNYKSGAFREIVVGVGLCEPRKSEKSYKFCSEDRVVNKYSNTSGGSSAATSNDTSNGKSNNSRKSSMNQIKIGSYTSISSEMDTSASPSISNLSELAADNVDKLFND